MESIDNGDLNIDNIACKIQMIIQLIEQRKKKEKMTLQMKKKEMK